MIPLKLTLKGIYSYQKEQVIDFSPLAKAKLFGIFGNTGSGKSSILEAITFVLYGRLERLNKSDRINYSLMNLKSKEMSIDFIFRAGDNNANEYRFLLEGKRKKDFNEVELKTRRFIKDDDEWVPIEVSAKEIIGLDYDNFKRTIIIPQGKFQDFLQLTPSNRTKMLKEIFDLHRYDLFSKSNRLHKDSELRLTEIVTRLSDLEEISEERIEERAALLEETEKEITELVTEIGETEGSIAAFERVKALFDRLNELQGKAELLKAKESGYREREDFIKSYESCYFEFHTLLEQRGELLRELERVGKSYESGSSNLERLNHEYSSLESEFKALKESYEQLDSMRGEVVESERALKVKSYLLEIEEQKGLHERIVKGILKIDSMIDEKGASVNGVKDKIRELKGAVPELNRLNSAKDYFTRKAALTERAEGCSAEIERVENRIDELTESTTAPIVAVYGLKAPLILEELQSALASKLDGYREQELELNERASELKLKVKLEEFAGNLHEGESCPLCGSKEHPDPVNYHNLEEDLAQLDSRMGALEEVIRNISEDMLKVEKIVESRAIFIERRKELQEELESCRSNLRVLAESSAAFEKEYSGLDEVNGHFSSGAELQARISRHEGEHEQLESEHRGLLERRERGANEKIRVENELSGLDRVYNDNLEQLANRGLLEVDDRALVTRVNELKEVIPRIERDYGSYQERLKDREQEIIRVKSELKAISGQLSLLEDREKRVSAEVEQKVEESQFSSLNEIEGVLSSRIDLKREKEEIAAFSRDYETTFAQIESLKRECEGVDYDSNVHNQLIDRLSGFKNSLAEKREEMGKLKTIIEEEKRKLILKGELEVKRESEENRLNDIKLLRNLFKGNGFVNYISTIYLNNLCNAANSRFFALTNKNLKLRINENNDFEVIDYLNEGRTRSIKTLSGGQLFQAALSLALSLSDNFQNIKNLDQHFFFLDEGFGALDNETLQIVFKTLQSLYKENRMVGVISHVDELKNNIDYFINVERDPQEGSLIRYSWE